MKLVAISELKGNEIIAEDVLTMDYKVLLSKGVELSVDYIRLLEKNSIRSVYIKEDDIVEEMAILKEEIQEEIHGTLQNILEKHTYTNTGELSELCNAADEIIRNILQEEDVLNKVYDIKERSADVYEHSISVCSIATLIALKNRLERNVVHDIGVASLLHELGLRYITIKYENCEISNEDETEYKKHPVYAYSALQNESWLTEDAKQMILYHHERMDGTGFPMKATDSSIPCRIIQVCDVFDEFVCGIGCERVKVYEALEYLKIYKGTKFDKNIVEDFLDLVAVYPVGSYVKTNEGETAVVLRQNKSFPDRPVVRIIKDKEGNPVKNIIIKDMLKITTLFIEGVE